MKWGRGRRDRRRRRDGGGSSHSPRRDKGNQLRSKVRVWIQNTLFFYTNLPFDLFPRRVRDREPPCPGAGGQEGAAGGPGQGQE